jgi:ATP adenylyltransferase
MQHLYTPWRMAYIKGEKKPVEGCVFCNKILADDAVEQVIARSEYVYVTLNLFPYNNGHLMVVPYDHITSQEDMPIEALTDMMVMTNRALAVLRDAYKPQAFNIGANIGAAAGAGIAAHYHFHVVPRWNGDANFMSTIGNTRVIPDTLDNTFRDLKLVWGKLFPEKA